MAMVEVHVVLDVDGMRWLDRVYPSPKLERAKIQVSRLVGGRRRSRAEIESNLSQIKSSSIIECSNTSSQ
jgi:hypothetical protein